MNRQNFSFPEQTIIYYVAKNASTPKVYQNLVKSCKYFHQKNPIILYHCLDYVDYMGQHVGRWHTCSNPRGCLELNGGLCMNTLVRLNLNSILRKIWVSTRLIIRQYPPEIQPMIILPKNFQSTVVMLECRGVTITLNQLAAIGKCVKFCNLRNVTVTNDDQNPVSLSKIIESLPKLEKFNFRDESLTSHLTPNTVKELLEIPEFLKLKTLTLENIPEAFDIEAFYQLFVKDNQTTNVQLRYSFNISANGIQRIEGVIDEILASNKQNFWPPYIHGLFNASKIEALTSAYRKGYVKYSKN